MSVSLSSTSILVTTRKSTGRRSIAQQGGLSGTFLFKTKSESKAFNIDSPSAHMFPQAAGVTDTKTVGHEQHLLLPEKDASAHVFVQKQAGV